LLTKLRRTTGECKLALIWEYIIFQHQKIWSESRVHELSVRKSLSGSSTNVCDVAVLHNHPSNRGVTFAWSCQARATGTLNGGPLRRTRNSMGGHGHPPPTDKRTPKTVLVMRRHIPKNWQACYDTPWSTAQTHPLGPHHHHTPCRPRAKHQDRRNWRDDFFPPSPKMNPCLPLPDCQLTPPCGESGSLVVVLRSQSI
jgi:hypothetical protein